MTHSGIPVGGKKVVVYIRHKRLPQTTNQNWADMLLTVNFRTKKKQLYCQSGQVANDNKYTLFRNTKLFSGRPPHQLLGDEHHQLGGGPASVVKAIQPSESRKISSTGPQEEEAPNKLLAPRAAQQAPFKVESVVCQVSLKASRELDILITLAIQPLGRDCSSSGCWLDLMLF